MLYLHSCRYLYAIEQDGCSPLRGAGGSVRLTNGCSVDVPWKKKAHFISRSSCETCSAPAVDRSLLRKFFSTLAIQRYGPAGDYLFSQPDSRFSKRITLHPLLVRILDDFHLFSLSLRSSLTAYSCGSSAAGRSHLISSTSAPIA